MSEEDNTNPNNNNTDTRPTVGGIVIDGDGDDVDNGGGGDTGNNNDMIVEGKEGAGGGGSCGRYNRCRGGPLNWCKRLFVVLICFGILLILAAIIASVVIKKYYLATKVDVPKLTLTPDDINNDATTNTRVIIVGGGASGMFAAYTLEYLGIQDYVVLEASSQDFGGRVQELSAGDFVSVPLDLGAEWIHADPSILQDLLLYENDQTSVAENIQTMEYEPQTYGIYSEFGGMRYRDFFRFFYREYKFVNTTWYSYLSHYVYPYISNNLKLNSVVKTIQYSNNDDGGVTVTTTDGTEYTGSHVIVATPVKILQEDTIEFIPPLPDYKLSELNKVNMPPGLKLWIEFEERFYPDIQIPTRITQYDAVTYLDAVYGKQEYTDSNVMLMFQIGDDDETYERVYEMNETELVTDVLSNLDTIFGSYDGDYDIATRNYKQHYVQNWSKEPYIHGMYSINDDYSKGKLLEPLLSEGVGTGGRPVVYFCGEYVASYELQSTVHGAAISGRTVAEHLVKDILNK